MKGLRNLREEADFSRRDLAQKLNMSEKTLYAYEKDIRSPSMQKLKQLSKFFKCKIEDLF